jgi:hypothetical protein
MLISLLVCFALVFMSGVTWNQWYNNRQEKNSIMWSITFGLLGLYHLIALIGATV